MQSGLPTIRSRSCGMSCATNTVSMSLTKPTSNPTEWATEKSHLPKMNSGWRHTCFAPGICLSAIRTSPPSSSGHWAMKPATESILMQHINFSNRQTPPARCSMNRLTAEIIPTSPVLCICGLKQWRVMQKRTPPNR